MGFSSLFFPGRDSCPSHTSDLFSARVCPVFGCCFGSTTSLYASPLRPDLFCLWFYCWYLFFSSSLAWTASCSRGQQLLPRASCDCPVCGVLEPVSGAARPAATHARPAYRFCLPSSFTAGLSSFFLSRESALSWALHGCCSWFRFQQLLHASLLTEWLLFAEKYQLRVVFIDSTFQ